jgi:pyruvate-formate lyase-activating enzyme
LAETQLPFAINTPRILLEEKAGRLCRICWERNGDGNQALVKSAAVLSLVSAGDVKFDLKAFDAALHVALTGMPTRRHSRTLNSFMESSAASVEMPRSGSHHASCPTLR